MQGLTPKQAELLTYLRERETTPSFEEIKQALGLSSKSGVYRLIEALEERGFIERLPNRARSIRVLETPRTWSGQLAAFAWYDLATELRRRGFKVERAL